MPFQFQKAIVYHGQAQFHPTRYVFALAKAFEETGGVILQHCPVHTFEKKEDLLRIETGMGSISAKSLVWATHIPPGINLLHFRNAPYRSYAVAVKLADDGYPDALAYDMYDPYHYLPARSKTRELFDRRRRRS